MVIQGLFYCLRKLIKIQLLYKYKIKYLNINVYFYKFVYINIKLNKDTNPPLPSQS